MSAPLPFIARHLPSTGSALDVACGTGRHVALMIARGLTVTAVDRDAEALAHCTGAACVLRDVEAHGLPEEWTGRFDLVVTTCFLYRPLLPAFFRVLKPGGVWLMETFHVENHLRSGHPRRRELCWETGEAGRLAEQAGFQVRFLDEGLHDGIFTTQLAAQRV